MDFAVPIMEYKHEVKKFHDISMDRNTDARKVCSLAD
jgi:hypothetical protein